MLKKSFRRDPCLLFHHALKHGGRPSTRPNARRNKPRLQWRGQRFRSRHDNLRCVVDDDQFPVRQGQRLTFQGLERAFQVVPAWIMRADHSRNQKFIHTLAQPTPGNRRHFWATRGVGVWDVGDGLIDILLLLKYGRTYRRITKYRANNRPCRGESSPVCPGERHLAAGRLRFR